MIRGKNPFRILDVNCPDKSFTIKPSKEAKVAHVINVLFTAGANPGKISQKINIRTDQGKDAVLTFTAFAEVIKSGTAPAAAEAEPEPEADDAPSEK